MSNCAPCAFVYRVFIAIISLVIGLSLINQAITSAQAETIQIFARVGISQDDFLLNLGGIQPNQSVNSQTTTTYSLTYASLASSPTEIIVLRVSWDSEGDEEVLRFRPGSATTGIGPSNPVVDIANKTITWQISPMPANTQHTVYWQLETIRGSANLSGTTFAISAKLIGPDFEKIASPLIGRYQFVPASVTPTPPPIPTAAPTTTPLPSITPTPPVQSPTPTPTIEPTSIPSVTPTPTDTPGGGSIDAPQPTPESPPNLLRPLMPVIAEIPIIGPMLQDGLEFLEEVALQSGGLIAAPLPVLLTLIPVFTTLIPLSSLTPWWQLPALIAALFWRRRADQWGVIYDSETKEPIDPAIVTLNSDGKRKSIAITDYFGRYQFLVNPGQYSLTVDKSNYSFPAKSLIGRASDGVYDNLYYGQELSFDKDDAVVVNIPLDATQADWNQQHKSFKDGSRWHRIIASNWLFWIGFIWSILMVLLAPTLLNLFVFGLYLLLTFLRKVNSRRQPWGVLYDKHHRPVTGARIELVDSNNPEVKRAPVITRTDGRYSFLVSKGEYQLRIQLRNEAGEFMPALPGPKVVVHSQYGAIARDLVLE